MKSWADKVMDTIRTPSPGATLEDLRREVALNKAEPALAAAPPTPVFATVTSVHPLATMSSKYDCCSVIVRTAAGDLAVGDSGTLWDWDKNGWHCVAPSPNDPRGDPGVRAELCGFPVMGSLMSTDGRYEIPYYAAVQEPHFMRYGDPEFYILRDTTSWWDRLLALPSDKDESKEVTAKFGSLDIRFSKDGSVWACMPSGLWDLVSDWKEDPHRKMLWRAFLAYEMYDRADRD